MQQNFKEKKVHRVPLVLKVLQGQTDFLALQGNQELTELKVDKEAKV